MVSEDMLLDPDTIKLYGILHIICNISSIMHKNS